MRGEGTAESPYIPESCGDFIEAVQTSGVFVKLEDDIDFSKDEVYGEELDGGLNIKCKKCYADKKSDGSLVKVNGLIVRGKNFIYSTDGSSNYESSFENIFFSNCVHKKTVSSGGMPFYVGAGKMTFNDCKISMLIKCNTYNGYVDNANVYYKNTPQFFKFTYLSNITATAQVFQGNRENCTIEFQNLPFGTERSGTTNDIAFKNFKKCSIKGSIDICNIYEYYKTINIYNIENSMFAITFNNKSSLDEFKLYFYGMTDVSVIDKTLIENSNCNLTITGQITKMSTEDIKNLDKLVEANFIP